MNTLSQISSHDDPRTTGLRDICSRWLALMLVVLMLLPVQSGMAQQGIQLPDMGGPREVLSQEETQSFPREFELFMRAQNALIEDPIVRNYFTDMGFRLVMHSDGRDRDFHFHVLRVPGINAFAAPAGVVALNAGLILAAKTESEVAGVVAHEISHVTQDHIFRRTEEAQRVSFPMMLATMGLVLAGGIAGGVDGDAVQGLIAGGMGLAEQAQINYTRQNEAEADRIGIQLMARAGYDPNGMVSFFQTLTAASRAWGDGPPEYLRTHPLSTSRVAEAKQRVELIQPRRLIEDELFYYVQARLRVLMTRHADTAVEYFQAQLERGREPESAQRYGLALSYLLGSQLQQAERELRWLLDHDPDAQLFRLLEAELLLRQNRHEESLVAYERLFTAYGQSEVVALDYAEALLHGNNTEHATQATEILREQMRLRPNDIKVSELLAHAADTAGDEIRSLEAVAENYYQRGGLPQAIEQLEGLIRRDDLDYYQRARISARLSQLRTERARMLHSR
ncbi:MAG: M48 family metalloprotease [Pseudomonadota bacterium]